MPGGREVRRGRLLNWMKTRVQTRVQACTLSSRYRDRLPGLPTQSHTKPSKAKATQASNTNKKAVIPRRASFSEKAKVRKHQEMGLAQDTKRQTLSEQQKNSAASKKFENPKRSRHLPPPSLRAMKHLQHTQTHSTLPRRRKRVCCTTTYLKA